MTRRRHSAGFSIIELMVAMSLLAIVLSGITSLVLSSSRAQTISSKTSVLQGQLRGAFEMLTHDVMTASTGANSGILVDAYSATTPGGVVLPVNVTSGGPNGTDIVDLINIDSSVSAQLLVPYTQASTQIFMSPEGSQFNVGDSVMVSDLNSGYILLVTAKGGSASAPVLVVNTGTNPIPAISNGTYATPGSWVFRVHRCEYSIDPMHYGPKNPALMYDSDGPGPLLPEPLGENVDDLQVAVGLDTTGTGIIGTWVNSGPPGTPLLTGANMSQLRAVRITLVGRVTMNGAGTGAIYGSQPKVEDHLAPVVPDGMPRRVLSSEITVRNMNL